MKIGVDINPLMKTLSGYGRYVYNIVTELLSLPECKKDIFYLYSARESKFSFREKGNFIYRKGKGLISKSGTLWLQTVGLRMINKDKVDVFWGTQDLLPIGLYRPIKKILTIHDLVWLYHQETMSTYNYFINAIYFKHSLFSADIIITPSNSIKKELILIFKIDPSKIKVVYEGVGSIFRSLPKKSAKNYVKLNYSINSPFLLSVGTVEPRKNYITLLAGMKLLPSKYKLVIIGKLGWKYKSLLAFIEDNNLLDRIILLGFVLDKDLPYFYNACELFVSASLYEGFGLPIVEAMACARPVLCSDVPVFREIARGSALYFQPDSAEDFATKARNLLQDLRQQENLVQKGNLLSKKYNWRRAAKQISTILHTL